MGEKTGVLMLMIATLVASTILLVINKGGTTEIGEDIRGKMSGIVNSAKEDEDGSGKVEDTKMTVNGEDKTSKYLVVERGYIATVTFPKMERKPTLEEVTENFKFIRVMGNKGVDLEESKKIVIDYSGVDFTKKGSYTALATYDNEESGVRHQLRFKIGVGGAYSPTAPEGYDELSSSTPPPIAIYRDVTTGKMRMFSPQLNKASHFELKGNLPSRDEWINGGVMYPYNSAYYARYAFTSMMLNKDKFDVEFNYNNIDLNVPGVYYVLIGFTDKETGKKYGSYVRILLYSAYAENFYSDIDSRLLVKQGVVK